MGGSIRESGLIIIWRELVSTLGLMGDAMRVSIKMTKSMALAFTAGQTSENTRDIGTKENSMDLVSTLFLPKK